MKNLSALRHPGGETRSIKAGGKRRKFLVLYQTVLFQPPHLGLLPPLVPSASAPRSLGLGLLAPQHLSKPFLIPNQTLQIPFSTTPSGFPGFIFEYLLAPPPENTDADHTTD